MKYKVFVDDNFHYMDDSHRYKLGEYDTLEKAIAACKKIVNEFLYENYKPGMTDDELSAAYGLYGEDPYIVGAEEKVPFSARDYASKKAGMICKKEAKKESEDEVYIPKDLEDCFVTLNSILKPSEINTIKSLPDKHDLIGYHFGIGAWMRNAWGLWNGSRLEKYFIERDPFMHPDDISQKILEFYYDWLNGNHEAWREFDKNIHGPRDRGYRIT